MKEETVKMMKGIVTFVGTIGVAAIIGNGVQHVSPIANAGFIKKLCIGTGTMLLGGLASDAATKYAEKKIDKLVDSISVEVKENSDEETTEQ